MGLETARASLERAVATLFAPVDGADSEAACCAICGGSVAPLAPTWRALRDFPVCARSVVAEWRRRAAALAPRGNKSKGQTKRLDQAELRAASMARLCAALYQCGLLAGSGGADDRELVAMLVDAMDDGGADRPVLRRVLRQRSLARRVRLHVFQYALRLPTASWVGEVALAFQDELKQASIEPHAHTGPAARKSKKRGRGSMGSKGAQGGSETGLCVVCGEPSSTSYTTRGKTRLQETLIDALREWLRIDGREAADVETVEALIGVLSAPEVVQLLQRSSAAAASARPGRDSSVRPSRAAPRVKLHWDDCDRVAESVCMAYKAPMWRLVWRRERARVGCVAAAAAVLEDVVALCVVADQFTRSTPQDCNGTGRADAPIGFRVLRAVTAHARKNSNTVVTTLRAIAAARERKCVAATSQVSRVSVLQAYGIYVLYVQFLLDYDEIDDDAAAQTTELQTPSRRAKSTARQDDTMDHLVECVGLVHKIVGAISADFDHLAESKRRELLVLWFQLVSTVARVASERHGAVAAHWSSFLDAIAQCCEQVKAAAYCFSEAFNVFVGDVLVGIIASDGARISSPEGCDCESIPLPMDTNSQDTLQALLGLIITAAGEHRVVSATICRLLVVVTRQYQARSQTSQHHQSGRVAFPRLLFPLLDAYLNNVRDPTEKALSCVVELVQLRIQKLYNSCQLTHGLLALLLEWDSYCERHSQQSITNGSHRDDSQPSARKGLQAAREHGVWQDLVRFYASDTSDSLAHEPHAFLAYVSDLLRSIAPESCPSDLEGSLFSVLTKVGTALSQSQARRDLQPVSHSDKTILRFIQAFESSTVGGDGRDFIAALRRENKLEDLTLNLRRWLGILGANPKALPTEAAMKLVMLANRLVFWCGPELTAVEALLVPVDGALLSALQSFSTLQPSSTSQVSIVRLTVMVRAYLAVSTPPNLVALTVAIVEATLNSTSSSVRDALVKVLHGFAAFLVVEVISERLQTALLQVCDRASAKFVRNALTVVVAAPRILRPRFIEFSLEVFSVPTAEKWLSSILLVGVSVDPSVKSLGKTVESFLACLENLLSEPEGVPGDELLKSKAFQHAYAVDALLSTALLALSRKNSASSYFARLTEISRLLRAQVSKSKTMPAAGTSEPTTKGTSLLLITCNATSSKQLRKRERSTEAKYTSCIVFAGRQRTVSFVPDQPPRPVTLASTHADILEMANQATASRWCLSFSSWITSAFVAQQHAPGNFADADYRTDWENIFSDTVLQFYLPVQFDGDTQLLVAEWLSTWIEQSVTGACCIDVLPFQRSMLLELVAAENPWNHLARCTKALVSNDITPTAGIEMINHIVKSLDLAVLSSARIVSLDDIESMADDMATLLEQISKITDSKQRLAIAVPVLEAFVRASLRASSLPQCRAHVIECVQRVGVLVRQVLAQFDSCPDWWSQCLSTWTRRFSHLNRKDVAQIMDALEFQVCDLTGSDDDNAEKATHGIR